MSEHARPNVPPALPLQAGYIYRSNAGSLYLLAEGGPPAPSPPGLPPTRLLLGKPVDPEDGTIAWEANRWFSVENGLDWDPFSLEWLVSISHVPRGGGFVAVGGGAPRSPCAAGHSVPNTGLLWSACSRCGAEFHFDRERGVYALGSVASYRSRR